MNALEVFYFVILCKLYLKLWLSAILPGDGEGRNDAAEDVIVTNLKGVY